jgi:hypothetical protein
MKPVLGLFKLQRIILNVFNTGDFSIFSSSNQLHVTEISGAVDNFLVNHKYHMFIESRGSFPR